MKEFLWRVVAKVVSQPAVSQLLYRRSTPYFDIYDETAPGIRKLYMHRVWVFNKFNGTSGQKTRRFMWLPAVRIHHINRADWARHPHNHPWPARTIILKGWYVERRDTGLHVRNVGDTATLGAGEFHHIERVSPGGVWTLFFTWDWAHVWGFRTPERTVPWREYLGVPEGEEG